MLWYGENVLIYDHCSEISGVAPKLIATVDDLKEIATKDKPNTKAIVGWRKALFGNNAMKLKNGKIALSIKGKTIIQIHSLEAKPCHLKHLMKLSRILILWMSGKTAMHISWN